MNKQKLIITSLLLLAGNVWASVSASVDRSQMAVGQSFTLTINLPDSNDNPELDILKNSFEIYDTSTNSQTSIINGKVSSQSTFTVNLIPKTAGKQIIPPIKVGNDVTNSINIEVLPAAAPKGDALKDSSVYLEASVAKQNLYIGVPFLYTVRLYYSVPLANLNMEQLTIDNAQVQAQGKSTQYQSTEDGKTYQVIEQKFLITPTKAGNLNIPPARIRGAIAENDNNNFFPMMANKPFMANSKPVSLKVKAVPTTIAINEWLPAKQLKVSDSWSQNSTTLKVGEPLTHTINLEALGIPATSIPELQAPAINGVNAYPDKPQSDTTTQNGDLLATKTFKIAYIPTVAGTLNFPEIKIKWWDIASDSLKTAIVPARTYTVIADRNSSNNLNSSASTQTKQNNTTNHALVAAKALPNSNLWQYLTLLFASLWLITATIGIGIYRKLKHLQKAAIIPTENSLHLEISPLLTNATSIQKACHEQNLHKLNNALISWARGITQQKIYSLADIKARINHPEFNKLLDELNSAIYKGSTFSSFNELLQLIKVIESTTLVKKSPTKALQELYPQ
jgi:hypothetical protein